MHSLMQWPSCTCTWWVSWLSEMVDKLVGGSCVGGLKSAFKNKELSSTTPNHWLEVSLEMQS